MDSLSPSFEQKTPRKRKLRALAVSVLWLSLMTTAALAGRAEDALGDVTARIDAGDFKQANAAIDRELAQADLTAESRAALEFQRERIRRIRLDFPITEPEAKAKLRELIPDMTDEEFAGWKASNQLEHMVIDGVPYYFSRSVSNLFRVSPQATARRATPATRNDGPMELANAYHDEALAQARASGKSSVAPRRVRVTQSIIVNADAVPAGEVVRAWIPFPRAIAGQQENIELISSVPAKHVTAPESTLQRTVYMELPAVKAAPTKFSVTYELTIFGQVHQIDPARVVPAGHSAELAPYLEERPPHIVFSDDIRAFSKKVVGDEKNPYRIAQKLYSAVDSIPWGGAREYSTISNISHYALHSDHADCGQQTLLLMTLLRLNGIPTRWQSGMVYSDGKYDNLHDWGFMYLAPYGWVPMDVTTGQFKGASDPGVEWFYLGGLDAYRIAFNDDYGTDLVPRKQHFRSETVDSQRGEVEWQGGNLYFDQWDYQFEAKVLPLETAAR